MMSATFDALRPKAAQLNAEAAELGNRIGSLDRRIAEALAVWRKFAEEITAASHSLQSLRASITILLDELDRIVPTAPQPMPPSENTGGRA